jgi:hypothetical protein
MRFISIDPISFAASDSNFYRFEGNGPAGRVDPSGLSAVAVTLMMAQQQGQQPTQGPWQYTGGSGGSGGMGNPQWYDRPQRLAPSPREEREAAAEKRIKIRELTQEIEWRKRAPGMSAWEPPPSNPFDYDWYDPFTGYTPDDSTLWRMFWGGLRGLNFFVDSFGRPTQPRGRTLARPRRAAPCPPTGGNPKPPASTPPRTARYGTLRNELAAGEQANHLNQNAAFRDIIPGNEGLSVGLRGNAFTKVGSPHYEFHRSLEGFWNQFRRDGARFGHWPTNAEYGQALEQALRAAGLSNADAATIAAQAAQQRAACGLAPNAPVPRIPRKINQTSPPSP